MSNVSILQVDMYTLPSLTKTSLVFLTNICIWAHESWAPDSCYSWLSVFMDMGGQSAFWDKQSHPEMWMQASFTPNWGTSAITSSEMLFYYNIICNMTCIVYFSRSSKPFMPLRIMYFLKTSGGTVSDTPNAIINKHLTMVRGSTRIPAVSFCRFWWWWLSHYWKWQFSFRF